MISRINAAILLCCFLLLANTTAAEQLELDVMSFNIRYGSAVDGENHWRLRKEKVFDVIRKDSPDIIGLQEALRWQIDEIKENVPGYGEVGVGRNDGKTKGEYSAILYRAERFDVASSGTFWLSDTPEIIASKHWGNGITRICTWGRFIDKKSASAFYLYNAHLDHQSQPSREKSVRLIAAVIKKRAKPDPFILTGDFNAGEQNPAIEYLTTKGKGDKFSPITMVDAFRVLHPEEKEVGTFNGFFGARDGEKIDFIFVQASTAVLRAAIVRTEQNGHYPSDHFPVTARLHLN